MSAHPTNRHFENAAPAHGATEAGDTGAADKPAAPGANGAHPLNGNKPDWNTDELARFKAYVGDAESPPSPLLRCRSMVRPSQTTPAPQPWRPPRRRSPLFPSTSFDEPSVTTSSTEAISKCWR